MSLETQYNLKHVMARRSSTFMTIVGISLVVMVFVATLMLAEGLRKTLAGTGSDLNVLVIRNGAQNEIQSGLKRDDTNALLADDLIARQPDSTPLATTDSVIVATLRKRVDHQPSNVTVRGTTPLGFSLREGVSIVAGRRPSEGSREIIVGSAIHAKFEQTDIGEQLRFGGQDWRVVGIFDAGNSGFSSEIWGDQRVLMPIFRREQFSSITLRLVDPARFDEFKNRIENQPRMSVVVRREREFYESQSSILAAFISAIGITISVFFSLGAILGAVITMYSAVATRRHEIGILRALGFAPLTIFRSFLMECLFISFSGGVLGVALAALLVFIRFSTTNFNTFSDLQFGFALSPGIALKGLTFSLVMGVLGAIFPALDAARTRVIEALRAA